MENDILTFAEILSRWPSDGALARDMGVSKPCARKWRERGRPLQPQYWPRLIDVAEQRFQVIITPRQLMVAARNHDEARRHDEAEAAAA